MSNDLPDVIAQDKSDVPKKLTPRQVLQETMEFHHNQAKDIIADIIVKLKEEKGPTGSLLAMLYKKYGECSQIACECASKLAPYLHPKLESVEIKGTLERRFVIRAPTVLPSVESWLAKAETEQKELAAKPGHEILPVEEKKEEPKTLAHATPEQIHRLFTKRPDVDEDDVIDVFESGDE